MASKTRRLKRAQRLSEHRPSSRLRRRVLLSFLGIFLVAVVGSALYRQVIDNEFLQHEGARRYLRVSEIPARRGMILDRNGEPLAVSTPVATVWADPRKLTGRQDVMRELAAALHLKSKDLIEKIESRPGRGFVYLKRRIGPDETVAVEEIIERYRLDSIGMESEYRRFYPSGEIFGHIIGFTDIDDRGIEGMELLYDKWLGAEPGLRRVIQDGRRRVVAEVERTRSPRHGRDLTLSLDRRLQFLAYRELKRAVQDHRASSATAVVLDVETGEVLAMVNQPAYNPNGKLEGAGSTRRNRALTDVMEPGSTVKPFVVAAALEAGLVGPDTLIDTAPGTLRVGRNRVKDVRNYGTLTTTRVLTKSSNVGSVKLAMRMNKSVLWTLYESLGFGSPTDSHFPGEVAGRLRHYDDWSMFEHATHAFGYGLSVTSLQLAQAYSVLGADGLLRPVSLLKRDAVPEGRRVLSERTTRLVRAMMETVVSAEGTAKEAAIEGYRVAGKTGTAKKAAKGGYAAKRYQAVFAGVAPASRPRFAMVVMVDEPSGKHYYGGKVAAPVFARVMQGALRLFNVAPDDPLQTLRLAGVEEHP